MDDLAAQSYLAPGEILLWSGTPARKLRLGAQHIPLLLSLLIMSSFLLIPIMAAVGAKHSGHLSTNNTADVQTDETTRAPSTSQPEPTKAQRIVMTLIFVLFAGSFIGLIGYGIVRQMGGASLISRSTLYVVTDQRVIIVTGKSKKVVTSLLLSTLVQVQMQQWSDGLGTITFGPRPAWPSNNGLYLSTPSLENILDSTKVFQLIAKGRGAA